jgi:hypothetical protein
MLTAKREPYFHSGPHDPSRSSQESPLDGRRAPGSARFMTALLMIGSLLAIPVGLASAYSIYHANFSTEAQCQSLRANIVSMLDKSADATTLRMLVRRDVIAFESTCGSVDPDAVAAFKTLLASSKTVAPARAAAPAKQVAHEPVRQLKEAARPVPAKVAPAVAESKAASRDTAAADAKWVASVREALIHAPGAAQAEAAQAPAAAPIPAPSTGQLAAPVPVLRQAPPAPAIVPATPSAAPALPPAASVAAAPRPAPAPDHPVPPAMIPDAAPMATASVPNEKPAASGIRGVIAEIPLLGRVVGK